MPSTRPRITFTEEGICNACQWADEKKTQVDWDARRAQLRSYCDRFRSRTGNFDCIIPVSGGKDSSYVSYMMKHDLGMHPLCVNIAPPLEFDIGARNLKNFADHGYDCMRIMPNADITRAISRIGLIEDGRPLLSWQTNVQVAIFKIAIRMGIPLVMFGEEGETEYGGTSKLKNNPAYDIDYSIDVYLSGNNPKRFLELFNEKDLYWWLYPTKEEFRAAELTVTHWSYFENWDPYQHYLVAKEKCGLEERDTASIGTFNNFAQTDSCLFDLHAFLMYLKFGFGRCTADVGIDIRRGAMTRRQGLELVKRLDGPYPEPYVPAYLDFFKMTAEEFDAALDRWANKDLFEKKDGLWVRTFEII
jgi:N-acetyl sugar amidotransferase